MPKAFLFFACLFIFFSACSNDDDLKDPVPSISLISISPKAVFENKDSIVIRFSYKDGDGDLGENQAGLRNLFVTDLRINVTDSFRIQQLAPTIVESPISGSIRLTIPSTFITNDTAQSEVVSYRLQVRDRAGNKSNKLVTPAITVYK
jgi:hypothetical protein